MDECGQALGENAARREREGEEVLKELPPLPPALLTVHDRAGTAGKLAGDDKQMSKSLESQVRDPLLATTRCPRANQTGTQFRS